MDQFSERAIRSTFIDLAQSPKDRKLVVCHTHVGLEFKGIINNQKIEQERCILHQLEHRFLL